MNLRMLCMSLVLLLAAAAGMPVYAAPSGAIFTTLPDGSAVNANIYPSKDLVYLDGGPGPGAPASAAGLPDGIYVFQVTDPSGKVLLSTDAAMCRQFSVSGGLITGVVDVGGCQHATGLDIDHGATTVQLIPFLDTPNHGGVYKAWATPVAAYIAGCAALGVNNGLSVVDCGSRGGNFHGFVPADSKTDNFKVSGTNREIDTQFHSNATGALLDGLYVNWIDTLGDSNTRWSYTDVSIGLFDRAHAENVENGTHYIEVANQAGCKVTAVAITDPSAVSTWFTGPQTLEIQIKNNFSGTYTVDAFCD
jgi:hypothetical protein